MRIALFASLVVLVAGSPVTFRSCGDDDPPDVTLPPSPPDAGVCVVDDDCPRASACADMRCLAGSCVLVATSIDRDGDGEPAMPCGNDCDDGDRLVRPGAPELCNGLDDDCNGTIDDGAPPTVGTRIVASLDATSTLTRLGDALIVTVGNDARTLDRYGRIGALFDVLGERSVLRTDTATAPDGRAIVASIVDDGGTIAVAVLTPGTPPVITSPVEIRAGGVVLDLAVVPHAGTFALAWVWRDPFDTVSLAVLSDIASTDPPLQFPSALGRAALASDGTSLAFPDGATQLTFLSADGTRISHPLDAELEPHGLASGEGFVVGLTSPPSTNTTYASRYERTAGNTGPALALLAATDFGMFATRVVRADGQYVAARAEPSYLLVTTFDETLTTAWPLTLPSGVGASARVSIAHLPGLVAVLDVSEISPASSDLVLLTDCVAP